jgi:xeroderma pigmentosum group C-complementing protein
MLGYDGHGGNRTATIRGIVVHDQNVELLREASVEWESHAVEVENQERRFAILRRWKRLVVGMLTKERLDREYG